VDGHAILKKKQKYIYNKVQLKARNTYRGKRCKEMTEKIEDGSDLSKKANNMLISGRRR